MTPIYQTPTLSFINNTTNKPMIHPEGNYSELNTKIKRVESLVEKNQPTKPLVFLYQPPSENPSGMEMALSMLPSMKTDSSPTHTFIIPSVGNNQPVTSMRKIQDFNDFNSHLSTLDDLINSVTSNLENEYSDHPLLYNKQVEFRSAKYIDNHQAFSFWPADKPFGEYPLSKPLFDGIIKKLNDTKEQYHICIDFVQDWENQYSSFSGPPKSYCVEINLFSYGVEEINFFTDRKSIISFYTECTKEDLQFFQDNHDALDKVLMPMFESLDTNIPKFIENLKKTKKLKM